MALSKNKFHTAKEISNNCQIYYFIYLFIYLFKSLLTVGKVAEANKFQQKKYTKVAEASKFQQKKYTKVAEANKFQQKIYLITLTIN